MEEQRRACAQDRQALEHIWLSSFPDDTAADVAAFFASGFKAEQAIVHTVDGQPVSMLFLLPVDIRRPDGGVLPAGYIYAVATLPVFRGRGICSALLQTAHRMALQEGMHATFLRPAQPSLERYYAQRGYRPAFAVQTATVDRIQAETIAAAAVTAPVEPQRMATPSSRRQNWLLRHGISHPAWSEAAWRYALHSTGGEYWETPAWSVLCEPSESHLLVREVLCTDAQLPDIYRHLCRQYRFSTCTLRRPAVSTTHEWFGMLHPLTSSAEAFLSNAAPCYMGPVLDA